MCPTLTYLKCLSFIGLYSLLPATDNVFLNMGIETVQLVSWNKLETTSLAHRKSLRNIFHSKPNLINPPHSNFCYSAFCCMGLYSMLSAVLLQV